MSSNYRPVLDRAVLSQHFLVSLDESATSAAEVWPVDSSPVIIRAEGAPDARRALLGQFGLLPHWARDPTLARRTYSARSETAAIKPNYKDAWAKGQRCIIPIECVFEPKWVNDKAERWKIERADGAPMGIAGLWSQGWSPVGVAMMTFCMLTVKADDHTLMQQFHKPEDEKRMVAVLDESQYDAWLDCPEPDMLGMLTPYPAAALLASRAPLEARHAPTRISNIQGEILY